MDLFQQLVISLAEISIDEMVVTYTLTENRWACKSCCCHMRKACTERFLTECADACACCPCSMSRRAACSAYKALAHDMHSQVRHAAGMLARACAVEQNPTYPLWLMPAALHCMVCCAL